MRSELKTFIGVAGLAVAMHAGAQTVVYPAQSPVYPSTTTEAYPADRVYEARVISSRAINGAPEERCRMERQQIGPLELPGALITGTVDLLTGKPQSTPYIQRCSTVTTTAYWDVTYEFNGVTHQAQLTSPPGTTITVNGNGDPRG